MTFPKKCLATVLINTISGLSPIKTNLSSETFSDKLLLLYKTFNEQIPNDEWHQDHGIELLL